MVEGTELNFPLWHIDMSDQELYAFLVKAACPICCNAYVKDDANWHLECLATANQAMEILRPGWSKKPYPSIATES
jgi:hypothetical protein